MPKQYLAHSLVYCVLASSFFQVSALHAATQVLSNGSTVNPLTNSGDDVSFTTPGWGTLQVADGKNLGTAGVSAITDIAHQGKIEFQGASTVTGTIGTTLLPLKFLDMQGGLAKTVSLQNNIFVDTLKFSSNSAVTVAAGKSITGLLAVSNDSQGNVTFLGGTTINNSVGAAGAALNTITINGSGTGDVINVNGNIFANTLDFLTNDEIKVADGVSINGNVTNSSGSSDGILTLLGNYTTGGDIGEETKSISKINIEGILFLKHNIFSQNDVIIGAGKKLFVEADGKYIVSSLVNNGTVSLGTNTSIMGYTQNTNSILNLAVKGGSAPISGKINSSGIIGAPTIKSMSTINVSFQGASTPDTSLTIIQGDNNNSIAIPSLTGNTQTYNINLTKNGNNVVLNIIRTPFPQSVPNPHYQGISQMLEVLGQTVDTTAPTLLPIINALEALPTAQALEEAISTFTPMVDTSIIEGTHTSVSKGFHAVSARLIDKRLGFAPPDNINYIAGDEVYNNPSWGKIFSGKMTQKNRQGIAGYDAYFSGATVGYEWDEIIEDVTLGLSGSLSYTKVHSTSSAKNQLAINSYQGTVYGSNNVHYPFYLDAMVSISYHDYTSIRNITIPRTDLSILRARAYGYFHGWQFTIRPEVGYEWKWDEFFATPNVWLQCSRLILNKYAETGAGSMNLSINYDNIDEYKLAGGVKTGLRYEKNYYYFSPKIHATIIYDFVNDTQSSKANLEGGGAIFSATGVKSSKISCLLGASIEWWLKNKQQHISLQYDFEFKDDFHMHAGFLKFKFDWRYL